VPDYDGRGEEPTTAGDVAAWVPRVLLSPLYLVSEFVVRRPLGWLITTAEEEQWAATLFALFQFGPQNELAIVPTALFDLGFEPSVGVYARWNGFLARHNKLRLHFATWGPDWLRITLADRIESSDERTRLQLRGEFTRRPDGLFYGTRLDNDLDNESRYQYELLDGTLSFDRMFWRASALHVFARLHDQSFSADSCCDAPSIETRIDDATLRNVDGDPLPLPAGYAGYTIYSHGFRLVIDTRRERPHPGSGVRLGLTGEHAFDVHDPLARRWVRWGVAPGVFVDLTDQNRVLHLDVLIQMIHPVAGEVPFTELIDLGDTGPLKGFVQGWVIGETAAAASLEYEWPIWVWLDGTLHIAAGNVFGPDFAGFELDAARLSTGLGIRTVSERDHGFGFILAMGTEPLRDGAEPDSLRLMFGGTRVF
jgi:hypothetical protein